MALHQPLHRPHDLRKEGGGKPKSELLSLETETVERLYVTQDDPLVMAALDMVSGRNVLFIGPTGTGKTVRQKALMQSENYPFLLAHTRWAKITVDIDFLELDLVQVIATPEVFFDVGVENGTSFRAPANIAAFILQHGYKTRAEFLQADLHNQKVLNTGKGTVKIFVISADDLDRIANVAIQNVILKDIENVHHTFNWHKDDPVRYLNVQCIASSNSAYSSSSSKYYASKGIDLAIFNRFFAYHVDECNYEEILKAEFEPQYHLFIEKLVSLALELRRQIAEGGMVALGELSLRQLRPIVFLHAHAGMTEQQAAGKLVSSLPQGSDEHIQAMNLVNSYFGERRKSRFAF